MIRNALLVDYDLCFGCHACEVACKQENHLPIGPKWIEVITIGPRRVNGKLKMDFIPMTCMHCIDAPCAMACPLGAITKREDGIVILSSELCNGCLACFLVCRFGAIQFNPDRNTVTKCNLCFHRIDKGLKPACVQACPAGAIYFGEINEITKKIRHRRAALLTTK